MVLSQSKQWTVQGTPEGMASSLLAKLCFLNFPTPTEHGKGESTFARVWQLQDSLNSAANCKTPQKKKKHFLISLPSGSEAPELWSPPVSKH